jgi:hypothetical protein
LARDKYPMMGNYLSSPPGATAGGMIYPQLHQKLHPFIVEACDEIDMYGLVMPHMCMFRCMCDKVCEKIFLVYPEMVKYDVESEAEAAQLPSGIEEQFRRMFPGEGFPRDMGELERRHPREFEEFRRSHPESFRRGSVFMDFILFLLFLEFLRRR